MCVRAFDSISFCCGMCESSLKNRFFFLSLMAFGIGQPVSQSSIVAELVVKLDMFLLEFTSYN